MRSCCAFLLYGQVYKLLHGRGNIVLEANSRLQYTTRGCHAITQNTYTTSTYATSIVTLLDSYT